MIKNVHRLGCGLILSSTVLGLTACSDAAEGNPAPDTGPTATGGGGMAAAGSGGTPEQGGMMNGGTGGAPTAEGGGGISAGGTSGGATNGGTAGAGASNGGMGGSGGTATGGSGGSGGAGGAGPACDPSSGKALVFDGSAVDYMVGTLGTDLPGGDAPRTVELWAKFTSAASFTAEKSVLELGTRAGGGNQVFGIDMSGYYPDENGGTAYFGPYTNGASDNNGKSGPSLVTPANAGWLHLAWAYEGNGGDFQFTINGEPGSVMVGAGDHTLDFQAGAVTLGASRYFGPKEGWAGTMDELRIWKTFRTPEEIKSNMKVLLKGDEEGLVAYYQFDEGMGEFTDDASGNMAHRLSTCPSTSELCAAANAKNPTWADSDIPGPFTCAP